jgi:anti-sigma-K factor RskA
MNLWRSLALAVVLAAAAVASGEVGAQQMPTNDPAALANVRESDAYTRLLRTNPAFRAKRMQIECGPITDPQLHASCVASFQAYAQPK